MMNMSVSALTSARLVVYVAATLSASSLADCSVRLYTCVISLPLALKACARCVATFPAPINVILIVYVLCYDTKLSKFVK